MVVTVGLWKTRRVMSSVCLGSGPHRGHRSGSTHLSTLQALYQPPYSPNGEPSFCFPWKRKPSSEHKNAEGTPLTTQPGKASQGGPVGSPCFVPLSPPRASIWVCSHLQGKASQTGSGSDKRGDKSVTLSLSLDEIQRQKGPGQINVELRFVPSTEPNSLS